MGGEMPSPFRGAWIGHLGAFLVADARMDVVAVPGREIDDGSAVFEQALGHADPVAEVAGQFQFRKPFEDGSRGPGVSKAAEPVCFVGDGEPQAPFEFERRTVEVLGFGQAPGI
jgi:hypothetical protein